jgi:hypothetical protein
MRETVVCTARTAMVASGYGVQDPQCCLDRAVLHLLCALTSRLCPIAGESTLEKRSDTMATAAENAQWFAENWFKSTKKAAWTLSTTFIVLIVPLIISMDRDTAKSELNALTGGDKK